MFHVKRLISYFPVGISLAFLSAGYTNSWISVTSCFTNSRRILTRFPRTIFSARLDLWSNLSRILHGVAITAGVREVDRRSGVVARALQSPIENGKEAAMKHISGWLVAQNRLNGDESNDGFQARDRAVARNVRPAFPSRLFLTRERPSHYSLMFL